jgi:hypothetical protein
MELSEFFGTILQSVVESHQLHLSTAKYHEHKVLNDFYEEMQHLADELIEHYQGQFGKLDRYVCDITCEGKDAATYLNELLEFVKQGYEMEPFTTDDALKSDLDGIVGLITSSLYQINELKESGEVMVSIRDYIVEKFRTQMHEEQIKNKKQE